jgi:hypothetical protein
MEEEEDDVNSFHIAATMVWFPDLAAPFNTVL